MGGGWFQNKLESFSIGEERRTKKGGKGRKRGGKEDKKGDKKEEKILKYKIWWAKKNKKQNKMILPLRFGEAFLNGHGKAFKIDGTIYTPV